MKTTTSQLILSPAYIFTAVKGSIWYQDESNWASRSSAQWMALKLDGTATAVPVDTGDADDLDGCSDA